MTDLQTQPEHEMVGIILNTGRMYSAFTRPPASTATSKMVRIVRDGLADCDTPEQAADWVLNFAIRFAAYHAEPVFDMHGNGPVCSYCGGLWPVCGHSHMSGVLDGDEDE